MTPDEENIFNLVRAELAKYKPNKKFQAAVNHPYCGLCYDAALALYCLLGKKAKGYTLCKAIDDDNISHYWVKNSSGEVLDPTHEQYTELERMVPYKKTPELPGFRPTKIVKEIVKSVQTSTEINGTD